MPPFKDQNDYRASHAKRYMDLYRKNRKFREREAKRKALWYSGKADDPAWLAKRAAKQRKK